MQSLPGTGFVRGLQFNIEDPYGFYADYWDAGKVLGLAERLHANLLIVFARDGWGRAFYKSRLYPRHPGARLRLEELGRLARERGITLIVMADHTANQYLYRLHPSWAQRGPRGEPRLLEHVPSTERVAAGEAEWPQICLNSPALDRYLVPEAGEALDASGAQGLLLDSFRYMPDPGRACYCRWCRDRFRRETGMELPVELSDETLEAYRLAWEWRYKVTLEALKKIKAEAQRRGALLLYNSHPGGWSGRGNRVLEEAGRLIDAVFSETSEADMREPGFYTFTVKLQLGVHGGPVLATRNAFYDLMPPYSAPPGVLEHDIWEIVAAGGMPVVTVFSSTATVDPRFEDTVAKVYDEIDRVSSLLEARVPLPGSVALLYSGRSHDWHIHEEPEAYIGELYGLALGLSMLHIPWVFTSEKRLAEEGWPGCADVLAAGDAGVLGDDALHEIERGLGHGKALLATMLFGHRRPDHTLRHALGLQEHLGLRLEGVEQLGAYYASPRGLEELPRYIPLGAPDTLFRRRWDPRLGEAVRVKPVDAEVLATLVLPKTRYGYEYTLGKSMPVPGHDTGAPLIAASRRTRTVYYAFRLGLHLHRLGLPEHLALLKAGLDKLGYKPPATLIDAPQSVWLNAYQVGEATLIHVVNQTAAQRFHAAAIETTPSGARVPGFEPTEAQRPHGPVPVDAGTLAARTCEPPCIARDPLTGEEKPMEPRGEWLTTRIGVVRAHRMLLVLPRA